MGGLSDRSRIIMMLCTWHTLSVTQRHHLMQLAGMNMAVSPMIPSLFAWRIFLTGHYKFKMHTALLAQQARHYLL